MSLGSNTFLGGGVAVDPATCTVYVAIPTDNDVQVLSEQTGQLLTTVSLITAADPSPDPVAVAVDPTTSSVFVANRVGDTVSVISEAQNPADDTLTNTISLSTAADQNPDPAAVAVDPDTGTVFVADRGFNSVSAIIESTDDVSSIPLDSASLDNCDQPAAIQPNGIAVDPDTGTVFVTNEGFVDGANTESDNVSVISETDPQDPANDELKCPIGLPYQDNPNQGSIPAAVALDPATGTVFVTDSALGLVSVISEATDSITTNVTVPNLGNDPALGVAVDPDTGTAYVVNDESIDSSDFDVQAIPSGSSSSCGSSSLCYQLPQSISFTAPASGTYGGQATLTPSATSGLPVTLSVDSSSGAGVCSLSGDTVFYTAPGNCVIDANQAGDSGYLPASQVSQTITVGQAPLTITASSATTTYDIPVPSITAGYSGLVNGDTSASLATQPSCSTTAASGSPAGQYPSDCSGAVDPDYAITYVAGTVTVNQATQSITFTDPPATGVVGKSATLTASGGGSGNPVTLSVDASSGIGVCVLSGNTVDYLAPGRCVIDANQAGNVNYTAAPQVSLTITVNQAPAFVIDSPPLTAVAGQAYSYTFAASGVPAPTYKLASGAPSWLSINASTGVLTGTLPVLQLLPFTYSVIASNAAGTATAGPFTVKPQLKVLPTPSGNSTVSQLIVINS
jgi:DNA-binding beta-propeller fold protein YncE